MTTLIELFFKYQKQNNNQKTGKYIQMGLFVDNYMNDNND